MPMVSQAQRRLMWWAKDNPKAAAKRGLKNSVARDFTAADTGGSLPERVKPESRSEKWYGAAGGGRT
jgi:hypothetical protein